MENSYVHCMTQSHIRFGTSRPRNDDEDLGMHCTRLQDRQPYKTPEHPNNKRAERIPLAKPFAYSAGRDLWQTLVSAERFRTFEGRAYLRELERNQMKGPIKTTSLHWFASACRATSATSMRCAPMRDIPLVLDTSLQFARDSSSI